MIIGRRCAICGRGQSQRRGGLCAFAAAIGALAKAGEKLSNPAGRYAHVGCMNATRSTKNDRRPNRSTGSGGPLADGRRSNTYQRGAI